MTAVEQVLVYVFGVQWWVYSAAGIYGIFWLLLRGSYKKDSISWKKINGWLIQDTWGNRYRNTLTRILDWIDGLLTPEMKEKVWSPESHGSAWSPGLLKLSLLIALAYPILSILVVWVAQGDTARIGALQLQQGSTEYIYRGLIGFFFISSVLLYFSASNVSSNFYLYWLIIASLSTFAPLALTIFLPSESPLTIATAAAAGTAVATISVVLFNPSFANNFAAIGSFASAIAVNFLPNLWVVIVFLIVISIYVAISYISKNSQYAIRFQLVFFFGLLGAMVSAVLFNSPPEEIENVRTMIVVLGFLPLLNALADFASTGLTRYCLRQGLRRDEPALKWAAYDLAGAALIFFLLVLSLMAVAEWVRWPGGIALIDLQGTLADIRANPADYWWLYITFLSTLLPTALHASVAILAIGLGWFGFLRSFIVAGLKAGSEGDSMWGMSAVWVLAVCLTVSVMIPVLIIGEGIPALPGFGFALLSFFEWIAGLMARV